MFESEENDEIGLCSVTKLDKIAYCVGGREKISKVEGAAIKLVSSIIA